MPDPKDVFEAIRQRDLPQLESLLASDPGLAEARDENAVSALMQAAYQRQLEMVEALRRKKKRLDVFEAAAFGDEGQLEELLAGDPSLASAWSPDGFTALHFTAFFRQPACAKVLIASGAPVAAVARNPMAVMPLHSAAASREAEITRLLLENGAPVDATQQGGWTALHAAAMHGDEPLADLLLSFGADVSLKAGNGKDAAALAREQGHAALADKLRPQG